MPKYDLSTGVLFVLNRLLPPSPQFDFLGESTEGNLQLDAYPGNIAVSILGLQKLDDVFDISIRDLRLASQVIPSFLAARVLSDVAGSLQPRGRCCRQLPVMDPASYYPNF
jgi:hypothetical protein